jgi:hypothetical protein
VVTENLTDDWSWEGKVQASIVRHMDTVEGFTIKRAANTATLERGPDILAIHRETGRRRHVEVKGYPLETYARGVRRGQPKPTRPQTQARHWFAEALFSIALAKSLYPPDEVAVGFPDYDLYIRLLNRIRWVRARLGIHAYLVNRLGEVRSFGPEDEVR